MLKSELFKVFIMLKRDVMVEPETIAMLHMASLEYLKTNMIDCESRSINVWVPMTRKS